MFSVHKSRSPLILTLSDIEHFSLEALKRLRKDNTRRLHLILSVSLVSQQKIYLDKSYAGQLQLAELLWREIEKDKPLMLKEIFYDYAVLESSLTDLEAYQFFWLEKTKLKALLLRVKKAGFKIVKLGLQDEKINLLPWREQLKQRVLFKQLSQLFFLPLCIFLLFYSGYWFLQTQNQKLMRQISGFYNANLQNQIGVRQELQSFNPVFDLILKLPIEVKLNEAELKNSTWSLSGTMTHLDDLTALNDILSKSAWQHSGASVDVHEQNQTYLWQLKKS